MAGFLPEPFRILSRLWVSPLIFVESTLANLHTGLSSAASSEITLATHGKIQKCLELMSHKNTPGLGHSAILATSILFQVVTNSETESTLQKFCKVWMEPPSGRLWNFTAFLPLFGNFEQHPFSFPCCPSSSFPGVCFLYSLTPPGRISSQVTHT